MAVMGKEEFRRLYRALETGVLKPICLRDEYRNPSLQGPGRKLFAKVDKGLTYF